MRKYLLLLLAGSCGRLVAHSQSHAVTDDTECKGVFHWYQKNAYVSTPQPLTPGWPQHTSTSFQILCPCDDGTFDDEGTTNMANHGADPGNADDRKLLNDVGCQSVTTKFKNLLKFRDSYAKCECSTDFLAVNSDATNSLLQKLRDGLSNYFKNTAGAVSGCDNAAQSATQLAGDISKIFADGNTADQNTMLLADVVALLGNGCSYDWRGAVTTAVQALANSYHVCNNDADALESTLWFTFQVDPDAFNEACDNDSPNCNLPEMYYFPPTDKCE